MRDTHKVHNILIYLIKYHNIYNDCVCFWSIYPLLKYDNDSQYTYDFYISAYNNRMCKII